ncbi:MAG: phage virion morphogenesis protein [Roseomonas sp.]|nr:phage virion morphogenesis protein [Roseomonas sp.]MCA3427586.1 phage virion morphogenesis protein [Roseomonas sp.]
MTGVRITINTAEFRDAIQGLGALMRRPQAAMAEIGEALILSTQERAAAEQSPDGVAWPKLNPGYAAAKRGGSMLRETGRLLGSLTRRADGHRVVVGTNVIYAAIHQFGGTVRPKSGGRLAFRLGRTRVFARSVSIPARPWLGVSDADRAEIMAIFQDHARRAMRGA